MNLTYCQKLIQDAISASPVPITLDELKSCMGQDPFRKADFNKVESLFRKKILEKVDIDKLKIMGLKMDADKVKGLVEIPDYSTFAEKLKLFGNIISSVGISSNIVTWECFTLKDGIVTLNTEEAERMKDAYRDYPQTDEEEDRANRVQIICDLLNALKTDFELIPFRLELENLITLDSENILCPSDVFIRTGSNLGNLKTSFENVVKANTANNTPKAILPEVKN